MVGISILEQNWMLEQYEIVLNKLELFRFVFVSLFR